MVLLIPNTLGETTTTTPTPISVSAEDIRKLDRQRTKILAQKEIYFAFSYASSMAENRSASDDLIAQHVALCVDNICKEEIDHLNSIVDDGKRYEVDHRFVYCLSEVVSRYAVTLAEDLGNFSKHAQRKNVSVDDIRLCCRKSEELQNELETFIKANSISYRTAHMKNSKGKTKKKLKGKSNISYSTSSDESSDDCGYDFKSELQLDSD